VSARSVKKLRCILSRADGVVISHNQILSELDYHPVRSVKDASRQFIGVASTLLGDEGKRSSLRLLQQRRDVALHGCAEKIEVVSAFQQSNHSA
jgi:hypothetical protein